MLDAESARALLLAIFSDEFVEIENSLAKMAYYVIYEKSNRISKKQSDNGKKGGRPKKPEEPKETQQNPEEPKKASVTVTVTNTVPEPLPIKTKTNTMFDEFWKAYPKKKAKDDAVKSWVKRKITPELFYTIMNALEQQKQSKEWEKDNGQYIPYPSTWINQGRWQDEQEQQPKFKNGDKREDGRVYYNGEWALT